jgi:hypothetical protein
MRILLALAATLLMAVLTHVPFASAAEKNSNASCSLMSEGIYHGAWVKHRIVVGEDVLFGTNTMGNILSQLESLRDQGLCQ